MYFIDRYNSPNLFPLILCALNEADIKLMSVAISSEPLTQPMVEKCELFLSKLEIPMDELAKNWLNKDYSILPPVEAAMEYKNGVFPPADIVLLLHTALSGDL